MSLACIGAIVLGIIGIGFLIAEGIRILLTSNIRFEREPVTGYQSQGVLPEDTKLNSPTDGSIVQKPEELLTGKKGE